MVTESEFRDIVSVLQERGLAPRYSVEDSADGGVEYHIHSHIEEVEDILWAINTLAVVETYAKDVQKHGDQWRSYAMKKGFIASLSLIIGNNYQVIIAELGVKCCGSAV